MAAYSLKNKFLVSLFAVFTFLVHGAYDGATNRVFAFKGDSVTLHTNITIKQQERVKWYFTDTLIARLNLSDNCIDVQCHKDNERFRDRLKLDNQTGDLTITNINTSDNGVYHLKIFSSGRPIGDRFDVVVNEVAAEMKKKSAKEGESVTLDTPEVKNPNKVMRWYCNDTLIANITGDQSKVCTDDQCKERFRDRLKLDPFGSLIITNSRTTDSGDYKLQIKSSRNRYSTTSIKSFTVSVTDSGSSPAPVAGIYGAGAGVVVLLVAAAIGVMIYLRKSSRKDEENPNDRRGSQHRAGGRLSQALPPQMSFYSPTFHPLPESESETE